MIQNSVPLGTHEMVKQLFKCVLEWPGNENHLLAVPAQGAASSTCSLSWWGLPVPGATGTVLCQSPAGTPHIPATKWH